MPRRITLPRSIRARYAVQISGHRIAVFGFLQALHNQAFRPIGCVMLIISLIIAHQLRITSRYLRMFRLAWPPRDKRGSTGRVQDSDVWRKGPAVQLQSLYYLPYCWGIDAEFEPARRWKRPTVFPHLQLSLISPNSTPRPGLSSAFFAKGELDSTTAACQAVGGRKVLVSLGQALMP